MCDGKVYGALEFATFIIGSRSMLLLLFSICSRLYTEDIVMAAWVRSFYEHIFLCVNGEW
jgi:hypothetical protein